MRPMDGRVDPQSVSCVEKAKYVRSVDARILKCESPGDLVLIRERLIDSRLQSILVRGADKRNLIVIPRVAGKVWHRIKAHQALGLRADPALWNCVAGERNASQ